VIEALRVTPAERTTIRGRPAIQLRGQVLPLVYLRAALGGSNGHGAANGHDGHKPESVVAVRWGKLQMGLVVDNLVGEQELVIKSLGGLVGEARGVSGAAILGDGRVCLIVDVPALFKLAGA
jgi:two-component system chemotaxis sensor kinase CheA